MPEKRPYKVVLESMTLEKKKLKSTISYDETAPSGYTFVPIGAPELAEYCKELSRRGGIDVFNVSTQPKNIAHKDPTNISHHIHRIGYHFRNDLVETACTQLGLTSSGRNRTQRYRDHGPGTSAIARRMDAIGNRIGLSMDTTEQDPEKQRLTVSLAIRDLFPKIPEADALAIMSRAFEEGSQRVGTQKDLTIPRRVQLAVLAHIRHTKTDYDNLLKTHRWADARRAVEQACLDQVVRWRGEDNEGDGELEDIFEEVIVLDDDDSSQEEELPRRDDRGNSFDIVADQRRAVDLEIDPFHHHDIIRPAYTRAGGSPEIISVKPRRILQPPALIASHTFEQRLQDTRARIAHEDRREGPGHAYHHANNGHTSVQPLHRDARSHHGLSYRADHQMHPQELEYGVDLNNNTKRANTNKLGHVHEASKSSSASFGAPRSLLRGGDLDIRQSIEVPHGPQSGTETGTTCLPGLSMPLGPPKARDVVAVPDPGTMHHKRRDPYDTTTQPAMYAPPQLHQAKWPAIAPQNIGPTLQNSTKQIVDLTEESPPAYEREAKPQVSRRPVSLAMRRYRSPPRHQRSQVERWRERSPPRPRYVSKRQDQNDRAQPEAYEFVDAGRQSPHKFYRIRDDQFFTPLRQDGFRNAGRTVENHGTRGIGYVDRDLRSSDARDRRDQVVQRPPAAYFYAQTEESREMYGSRDDGPPREPVRHVPSLPAEYEYSGYDIPRYRSR